MWNKYAYQPPKIDPYQTAEDIPEGQVGGPGVPGVAESSPVPGSVGGAPEGTVPPDPLMEDE